MTSPDVGSVALCDCNMSHVCYCASFYCVTKIKGVARARAIKLSPLSFCVMTSKKATFGRSLKSDFLLDPKYIPLNHGSFGTYPRQLQAVFRKYQDEAEAHPDRFNRLELAPLLRQNRERIAKVIGCPDPADLAFVQNASTGVGTVLRSFPFEKGDKVLCVSFAPRRARLYIHFFVRPSIPLPMSMWLAASTTCQTVALSS